MEPNDFGRAQFPIRKNGGVFPIDTYGTIEMIEKNHVLFKDNDGFVYLVDRDEMQFSKETKTQ